MLILLAVLQVVIYLFTLFQSIATKVGPQLKFDPIDKDLFSYVVVQFISYFYVRVVCFLTIEDRIRLDIIISPLIGCHSLFKICDIRVNDLKHLCGVQNRGYDKIKDYLNADKTGSK